MIQLDNWALTIAVHDPETAKKLAGRLIEAAAKRESVIRQQKGAELAKGRIGAK